jgi:Xaa-Pro aminopeptidase
VRAAGGRVLDVGDIILSEITPCYQGQFAQICRTTVIGKPTQLMQEKYAILQAAMRAGQKAAVPGASVRDVTAAMDGFRAGLRRLLPAALYAGARARARHHPDLPGDLTAESDTRLEQGMVFVMHPNQYIPETGYLMCGEPVVITPDGAKALSAKVAELDSVVS